MNIKLLFIIFFVLVIIGVIGFIIVNNYKSQVEQSSLSSQLAPNQNLEMKAPKIKIDKTKKYTAVLHTEKGDITISLNADRTPVTVNNFVTLAKKGFYDQTIFHRIIKGFMIQGGDPKGDGTGGPGYQFNDEPFTGEYTRGIVAMANAGPNTNGSQFFITCAKTPWLNMRHTIFGEVISGLEVVQKIENTQVNADDRPITQQKINRAYIKPNA